MAPGLAFAQGGALGGAQWIATKADEPGMVRKGHEGGAADPASEFEPLPVFRREFRVEKKVAGATLRVSGVGQFEAHINGKNVTDAVLTPGWSDYKKRVYYDTYDVTALLRQGENAIGVMLGNGMYNVAAPADRYTKFRGSFGQVKLIAELVVKFADGSEQRIASDAGWKTSPGPITYTSIYGGEDYDARREQAGWDGPAFDDKQWAAAAAVDGPGGELVEETIPPVKAFEKYEPVAVTHPKPGIAVYDLGENFAGWPEIEVRGKAGDAVRLLAGELLDANGLVTQRSAGAGAKNPNSFTYTLRGGGSEQWHPRFSYYGFRYVQVEAIASEGDPPAVTHLEGWFLHDAVSVDGTFTSSSDLFNKIHRLIDRAMLANMVSVLTDCPHREKLGWLEQTHLAGASLMYNYGLGPLYGKIAADMRDAQLANGMIPDIAPEFPVFSGGFRDSPEWGAAVVLSPWTAYQFYGDVGALRDQYAAMQGYMAYMRGKAQGHILAYGLGDWYDIGPKGPGVSQLTTPGVTGTAIYYQELTAMAKIAVLVGHPADAAGYSEEAVEVKAAFNARFFHAETGQYDTGSQTANAMPLVVGLVPEGMREAVLGSLIADIRAHGNHVTAGDVGFHYVVRALTDGGRSDVLFDMLSRTDKPSYGDQLAHGATTLTEAWDANPNSSQDHFMLGHAEEWFYRGLGGIDFDLSRESDRRIVIHPAVVGDLQSVKVEYKSKLGTIESAWERSGEGLRMEVTVPKGATATVELPAGWGAVVTLNGHELRTEKAIRDVRTAGGGVSLVAGGGTYRFELRR
jgi:hypothetical protein